MSNSFGILLRTTIFGQSHSKAIGVVLDGLPAGEILDFSAISDFMRRRAPGQNAHSTARREADEPEILSGLADGRTCGAPLCAVIRNSDTRSSDYSKLKYTPRPSHSDFCAFVKFHGWNDISGGGQFSGRLTAPLCFAGAVAKQLLSKHGITVGAHILNIAGIYDDAPDTVMASSEELEAIAKKDFPVCNDEAGKEMRKAIADAKADGDSLGGIIRCYALGLPVGLGEPMFNGMESALSRVVFAIPAVKGLAFGSGFDCATMRGSENNDPFYFLDGKVRTKKNDHGGILGGISTGMPLYFDVAVKPTPSIASAQNTVDLLTGNETELKITGRHDPCIVPRAVPCIEAAAALTILDHFMIWEKENGTK